MKTMEVIGMDTRLARYAGGAAYLTGILGLVSFVTLILFFALEASAGSLGAHLWGPLSDIAGAITPLPLLIVMLALHQIERDRAPMVSRVAVVFGVIGALAVTVLQLLLIFKFLTF